MKAKLTIGAIWKDRETGEQYELVAVNEATEEVQICPVNGQGYRTMKEKSLRSNYELVAMKKEEFKPPTTAETSPDFEGDTTPVTQAESPKPDGNGRAPKGRVQLQDGSVISGSGFITEVCGKSRDETYKVDSAIRWLQKPAGQELLTEKGATIVFGQPVTKK